MDLIEFASGSAESEWGSLRAKMGHPDPWQLNYFAIGNEVSGQPQDPAACMHVDNKSKDGEEQPGVILTAWKQSSKMQNYMPPFAFCLVLYRQHADMQHISLGNTRQTDAAHLDKPNSNVCPCQILQLLIKLCDSHSMLTVT